MTNEDKVAELESAIGGILSAAQRGNDADHDALAVIRTECVDVLNYIYSNDEGKPDKFKINLEYDRDEIRADAKLCISMGGDIYRTKMFLDQMYPAWNRDTRTMCMVELMFRHEDDSLRHIFEEKLAGLDA